MDYPFYLKELCVLPSEVHTKCLDILRSADVVSHPHFTSQVRNKNAYRVTEAPSKILVETVANYLAATCLPEVELYWSEINCLRPNGLLGEHSDLAYAGYNTDKGQPMEVLLTHKIHVHLSGESCLRFRRSKYEPATEFAPTPGTCYWYNNYVWHESSNPGTEDRFALSLIYHDRRWRVRANLFSKLGLSYNDCYQI